ncbi:hypothetical protein [Bradyrhizobium sp. AZCC 2289]|uniref:hypothetical protein n=1 Tax=Bradyrhizobium sp. AZCC 2289 TaxID=3117026 RepID=UPI002FF3352E
MSRKHLMMFAVAIAMIAEPACAELQGVAKSAPEFTSDELAIISRNAALSGIVKEDPWVVRILLDAIDRVQPVVSNQAAETPLPPGEPPASFDPNKNPDVERLQRASPEAVHDLFQLLKQVAASKPSAPK